jgi:hypothetical protein
MALRGFIGQTALASALCAVLGLVPNGACAQSQQADPHCAPIGGTILTNLAVIDASTTLGTATGDLKGAVAARVVGVASGPGETTLLSVQHHFVTESGDTVSVAVATATVVQVAPGLLAVVSYPVKIIGGTGKFSGATGSFKNIGEVYLPNAPRFDGGETIFRYSGRVCFAAPGKS